MIIKFKLTNDDSVNLSFEYFIKCPKYKINEIKEQINEFIETSKNIDHDDFYIFLTTFGYDVNFIQYDLFISKNEIDNSYWINY